MSDDAAPTSRTPRAEVRERLLTAGARSSPSRACTRPDSTTSLHGPGSARAPCTRTSPRRKTSSRRSCNARRTWCSGRCRTRARRHRVRAPRGRRPAGLRQARPEHAVRPAVRVPGLRPPAPELLPEFVGSGRCCRTASRSSWTCGSARTRRSIPGCRSTSSRPRSSPRTSGWCSTRRRSRASTRRRHRRPRRGGRAPPLTRLRGRRGGAVARRPRARRPRTMRVCRRARRTVRGRTHGARARTSHHARNLARWRARPSRPPASHRARAAGARCSVRGRTHVRGHEPRTMPQPRTLAGAAVAAARLAPCEGGRRAPRGASPHTRARARASHHARNLARWRAAAVGAARLARCEGDRRARACARRSATTRDCAASDAPRGTTPTTARDSAGAPATAPDVRPTPTRRAHHGPPGRHARGLRCPTPWRPRHRSARGRRRRPPARAPGPPRPADRRAGDRGRRGRSSRPRRHRRRGEPRCVAVVGDVVEDLAPGVDRGRPPRPHGRETGPAAERTHDPGGEEQRQREDDTGRETEATLSAADRRPGAAPASAEADGVDDGCESAGVDRSGAGKGVSGVPGVADVDGSVEDCAASSESGVGSNATQPAPWMYSSGHECSCRFDTVYSPSLCPCRLGTDGDAGRDAERAGHHRHRGREVHAVTRTDLEERVDDVHAVAVVPLLDGRGLGVREQVTAEPALEGPGLLVVVAGPGRDPRRGRRDVARQVLRQRQVGPEFRVRGPGEPAAVRPTSIPTGVRVEVGVRERRSAVHLVRRTARCRRAGRPERVRLPHPAPLLQVEVRRPCLHGHRTRGDREVVARQPGDPDRHVSPRRQPRVHPDGPLLLVGGLGLARVRDRRHPVAGAELVEVGDLRYSGCPSDDRSGTPRGSSDGGGPGRG